MVRKVLIFFIVKRKFFLAHMFYVKTESIKTKEKIDLSENRNSSNIVENLIRTNYGVENNNKIDGSSFGEDCMMKKDNMTNCIITTNDKTTNDGTYVSLAEDEFTEILSKECSENDNHFLCRKLIKFCNENTPSPSFVFKLISLIESMFLDSRKSFNDRAAFLSTALFKKNDFSVEKKETYPEFEDLLAGYVHCKLDDTLSYNRKYKCVENEPIRRSNPHTSSIQSAINLLNESSGDEKLITEDFMRKVPDRLFHIFHKKLFDSLTQLRNSEIPHFKSLSCLIKEGFRRNVDVLGLALEKFKETESDVQRTFLVCSFEILDDELLNDEDRVKLHLRFAETVLKNEILNKTEGISKKAVIDFINKGMSRYKQG